MAAPPRRRRRAGRRCADRPPPRTRPALEWSARLREHGFAHSCTLLALAGDAAGPPRDWALAAAIAAELFADTAAMGPLAAALAAVPDEDSARVLDEMRVLAPGIAAAVSGGRPGS